MFLELPHEILEIMKASGVSELFPPQKDAIRSGLLEKKDNFLLAMPTASGKTLLVEFVMINALMKDGGGRPRCLYVVPLVALAYDKFRDFQNKYKSTTKIGLSTGDYDSSADALGNYDIIILTIEKFDALTRGDISWLSEVKVAVLDEVHLVGDPSRGPRLEAAVARFRIKNPHARIVGLSATITNCTEFASWLDAVPVRSSWRPVPLKEEVLVADSDSELIEYVEGIVSEGGQALVFVNTKKGALSLARKMRMAMGAVAKSDELEKIAKKVDSDIFEDLPDMLRSGVAFHSTWLHPSQRHIIEESFIQKHLKVICCTPTLAMGVSFPARAAIIRNYRFFDGSESTPMPVFWVKQVFGRAGRPGYDKCGVGVLVARTEDEKEMLEKMYINQESEPINSRFSDEIIAEQILATIVGGVRSMEGISDFLRSTFYVHQGGSIDIDNVLQSLETNGFISVNETIKPTLFGSLTSRLYITPNTALILKYDIKRLSETSAEDFDLIALLCNCDEMPAVSLKQGAVGDFVPVDEVIHESGSATVLNAWINELSYREIHEKYGVYPGEVHALASAGEWVCYAAWRIADYLHSDLGKKFGILEKRIRSGIRPELIGLISIKGIGRVLARRLHNAGYKTAADIIRADEGELAKIFGIGKKKAGRIKEEVKHLAYEELRRKKFKR
jgi:helicase